MNAAADTPTEAPPPEMMTKEEHEAALREFKAQVRAVAMDMATQHNLCSTVEDTLMKVGISNEKRYVTVVTTKREQATYEVPADLLALYPDDATVGKMIADWLGGKLSNKDARAWQQTRHLGNTTLEGETYEVKVADQTTANYQRLYSSGDARVRHLVDIPPGVNLRNAGTSPALCGATPTGWRQRWSNTSSRGEERVCAKCSKALTRVQAAAT